MSVNGGNGAPSSSPTLEEVVVHHDSVLIEGHSPNDSALMAGAGYKDSALMEAKINSNTSHCAEINQERRRNQHSSRTQC